MLASNARACLSSGVLDQSVRRHVLAGASPTLAPLFEDSMEAEVENAVHHEIAARTLTPALAAFQIDSFGALSSHGRAVVRQRTFGRSAIRWLHVIMRGSRAAPSRRPSLKTGAHAARHGRNASLLAK